MICEFILSHSQSKIESGFSINKNLMVGNLQKESICALH